jgi:hypothetical protein
MTAQSPFGALSAQTISLIVSLVVVVVILVVRNSKPRALRIERLWIRPAVFTTLVAVILVATPPPLTTVNIALLAISLGAGAGLGWLRGRFMRIEVNPDTHDITSRASPVGMIFILALLVVRMALRGALTSSKGVGGISATAVYDDLILLAGGMMVIQGLEMWLRARRLLAQAQAAKAEGSPTSLRPVAP